MERSEGKSSVMNACDGVFTAASSVSDEKEGGEEEGDEEAGEGMLVVEEEE